MNHRAMLLCLVLGAAPLCAAQEPPSPTETVWEDLLRSDALLARGKVSEARGALDGAVSLQPGVYAAVLRHAYLSYLMKDYPAARASYAKAAALGPREEAPLAGLFYVSAATGDKDLKAAALKLLEVNPGFREADLAVAYADFSDRNYRAAVERYDGLLKKNPSDPDAWLGAAWSKYYSGKAPSARQGFARVLRVDPGNRSAREGIRLTRGVSSVGLGLFYAGIDYKNNAFKLKGSAYSVPVSLAFRRLAAVYTYSHTDIDWKEPTADTRQNENNAALSYTWGPASVSGAYNHISVNDPKTNGADTWTG